DRAEMLRRAKPPDHVGIARELIDPGAQRLVVIELHGEVDAPPIEADEARPNRHIERERLLRLRHLDRLDPRLASREVDSDLDRKVEERRDLVDLLSLLDIESQATALGVVSLANRDLGV